MLRLSLILFESEECTLKQTSDGLTGIHNGKKRGIVHNQKMLDYFGPKGGQR